MMWYDILHYIRGLCHRDRANRHRATAPSLGRMRVTDSLGVFSCIGWLFAGPIRCHVIILGIKYRTQSIWRFTQSRHQTTQLYQNSQHEDTKVLDKILVQVGNFRTGNTFLIT